MIRHTYSPPPPPCTSPSSPSASANAGLPARGKTHMTRRLARYLEFFHAIPVKVFNYNEYRRKKYGKVSNFFFDPTNVENMEKREIVYEEISAEVTQFMKSHPNAIAILDSTNATFKRRNALSEMIHATGMCVCVYVLTGVWCLPYTQCNH